MTSSGILVAGRYRLGERIGSGAMGVVWQAHDERLHRTVAVKQLLPQPGLSDEQADEARQRAMREGRIAARLAHPNAITVYDVAEHDGDPWLIMEYLPSKSLSAVLSERGTLPPEEAARIGTQVASALVAAHTAGIVHRDIKPANVLLGDDGTVKITDFGISRATGDVTVTKTGMLAGTPAYLAPEVAKGHTPTPQSDVFSLGSTLYTAIEGHSPFGLSENTLALLYAVAEGRVTPPRQAGPATALLMQLLRADATSRPSMTVARDALAAIAAGRTAMLHSPAPAPEETTQVVRPVTPPGGGTRLDIHPLAEPTPPGGLRPQGAPMNQPPGMPPNMPMTPARGLPPQAPEPRRNDPRRIALAVLAVLAAALIGILVASMIKSSTRQGAGAATSTTTPPAVTTTTSQQPTTTTTTTVRPPTSAEYANAVRDYYGLLPADPDSAWALLTANAQAKSASKDSYDQFWATIDSVEVRATQVAGNRVTATIHFTPKSGDVSDDPYTFTVVQQDGKLMIDDFTKLPKPPGSASSDTPTSDTPTASTP